MSSKENFVTKHMHTYNRATVEVDRKKKSKGTQRKMKHKGGAYD